MGVDFYVVVEPSEYEKYAEVIDDSYLIKLPSDFSKLGKGSIPVRNFVWGYALRTLNSGWHWILDDNIESIERYNNNIKVPVQCPAPFRVIEDFVLRYENISQAGMNYTNFCPAYDARPPIRFNTRIYSCILIRNDTGYRWRGMYNEDTDLSLRMLKDGWCTVLFNTFLIGKRATMCQKGGNEQIYKQSDNRKEFAESLAKQHPDLVYVTKKFGRWHHQVNYKPFIKNKLIIKNDIKVINGVNNYGMNLTSPE